MAGLSASGLKTQIKSYTETDSNVLTDAVLENIILNAQYKIFREVPIDANRKQQLGNLVAGQESINCPAGAVFIRGIQVYDTAGSETTGANRWLEKKDYTYLQEFQAITRTYVLVVYARRYLVSNILVAGYKIKRFICS